MLLLARFCPLMSSQVNFCCAIPLLLTYVLKAYEDQYRPDQITLFRAKHEWDDETTAIRGTRDLHQALKLEGRLSLMAGHPGDLVEAHEVLVVVSSLNDEESELMVTPVLIPPHDLEG